MLILSVGVAVISHNHAHLPLWTNKPMNRLSDYWIALLQGHPVAVIFPTHIENHHVYNHGALDEARTYRFGGDHNHLWGYLVHPFHAIITLRRLVFKAVVRDRHAVLQLALICLAYVVLGLTDFRKLFLFIIIPQFFGLHWFLSSNYLQHAHADPHSKANFARNFTGAVNFFWLNIGFHAAHHQKPELHWSKLPALHQHIKSNLHPQMIETSLAGYMLRTYFLSLFKKNLRSTSLMKREKQHEIFQKGS